MIFYFCVLGGKTMDKVDNLAEIKAMALDNRKVSLQHNLNKETAKDSIQSILDEGSFIEISAMYQQNGGGIIGGHGTINGRLVFVCSHDYTVSGGAINRRNGEKICIDKLVSLFSSSKNGLRTAKNSPIDL